MNEKASLVCVEKCATFQLASDTAKYYAREYKCEVSVEYQSVSDDWTVVLPMHRKLAYEQRQRDVRDRAFENQCLSDSNYNDDESQPSVFGNDWTHVK